MLMCEQMTFTCCKCRAGFDCDSVVAHENGWICEPCQTAEDEANKAPVRLIPTEAREIITAPPLAAQRPLFHRRAAWWKFWNKRLAWFLRDINGDRLSTKPGYCIPRLPHFYYLERRAEGIISHEKVKATYYEKDPVGYLRHEILFYLETDDAART